MINVLRKIIGDYARQVPSEVLLESRRHESTTDYAIADLIGVRYAAASEPSKRRSFAMALLKQATGGEPLTGRRPYEMQFEVFPEFKLWFSTNHPPKINDSTESAWRRIHDIPFDHVLSNPARGYEEQLMEEAPGILNWMSRLS